MSTHTCGKTVSAPQNKHRVIAGFFIALFVLLFAAAAQPAQAYAATALPTSGTLVDGETYTVPSGGLILTGSLTVPSGATVVIEAEDSGSPGALTYSGDNNIIVSGSLTINDITIDASNSMGVPAINLVEHGASFTSYGMTLNQAGNGTGDGSGSSRLGIFAGDINGHNGGTITPNNASIHLYNSSVTMTGNGTTADYVRAVGFWSDATGGSIILDNTVVTTAGADTHKAVYGQGVFVRPNAASTVDVQIINGSSVTGFYYPVFVYSTDGGSAPGTIGSKSITISDSNISGYAAVYFRSDGGSGLARGIEANITNSTLVGTNPATSSSGNSFAVITTQSVADAEINISGGSLTANSAGATQWILAPESVGGQNNVINITNGTVLNASQNSVPPTPAIANIGDNTVSIDSTVAVNGSLFDPQSSPDVCIINGGTVTNYDTFYEAVLHVQNGETIQLLKSFSGFVDTVIPTGMEFNLDLNGMDVDLADGLLDVQGALTIVDSTALADPSLAGTVIVDDPAQVSGALIIKAGTYKLTSGAVFDVSAFLAPGYYQDSNGTVRPKPAEPTIPRTNDGSLALLALLTLVGSSCLLGAYTLKRNRRMQKD